MKGADSQAARRRPIRRWQMQCQDSALRAAHVSPVPGAGMVITASGTSCIGNDRAGGRTDQSAGNRGTRGSTSETSDQGACAAANERTAEYAILTRRLAAGECQRHHSKQHNLAHPIPPSRFFGRKNFRRYASNLRRHSRPVCMSWGPFRGIKIFIAYLHQVIASDGHKDSCK